MRDAVLKVRLSGVQPSSQPAGASICLAPQPPAAGRHFMGVPCQRPLFSALRPPQRRSASTTNRTRLNFNLFTTEIQEPLFSILDLAHSENAPVGFTPVLSHQKAASTFNELSTPTLLIDATLAWSLRQSTLTLTLPEWLERFQTPTTKRLDLAGCTTADRRGMATQNLHHGSAV